MYIDDKTRVKHMLDAACQAYEFVHNKKRTEFNSDRMLQFALVRAIEIIGEAVKNISPDFKERYENIEWKKIAGMRDKIIHFYFGINWEIVWDVIKNKLPQLEKEIKTSLEKQEVDS